MIERFFYIAKGVFMNTEIENKLKTLPDKSGVYIMLNKDGEIIYVGKAKVLKNRVRQYFNGNKHTIKVKKMVENIADFEYIITDSEREALILENNLIKENMPKYNILLKDDKTYPFIKLTLNEDFPRVFMTRRPIRDGAKYFGPYCSNFNIKEVLEIIADVFPLRRCKKHLSADNLGGKPCLYYQMNKCNGVCTGRVSRTEYNETVKKIISFLNGNYDDVIRLLQEKMKNAAASLDFESAAAFRDRINSVSMLGEKQKIVSATGSDCDAIAVYNANDTACVVIFFVRKGKTVGEEHYFMSGTDDMNGDEILSDFIRQYYDNCSFIPHQLYLQHEIADNSVIEEWLSEKTNRSVKIFVPKIGDKLKLINMISANAKKQHSERELKIMRDISFKDNALVSLQKLTCLASPPMNIEAYDISNTSGKAMVGAMVTYTGGKPNRNKYRNFRIKYVTGQDDYACMSEVISRRIERALAEREKSGGSANGDFLPLPDLILLDGGMGHVDTVLPIIKSYGLDIPVFGIVKNNRHRTEGLISPAGEVKVDKSSEAFMLLTNIQDEMHRRAISYHRKLRDSSALKTEIRDIKGVGEKKAKILLRNFKSLKAIRSASLEELSSVAGIDKATAANVFNYFNGR